MFTLALGLLTAKGGLIALSLIGIVGMGWLTSEPGIQALQALGLVGTTGGLTVVRKVVAKTADYVVTAADVLDNTYFTTRGAAGAVNFTLPAASPQLAGRAIRFKNVVDQNMTVTAGAADTLIVDGDAAADSLAASTAAHKIGAEIEAFCDGTSWFAAGVAAGATYTVAT